MLAEIFIKNNIIRHPVPICCPCVLQSTPLCPFEITYNPKPAGLVKLFVCLCFRSVCFCSRQHSWADDFSYSSLEWLSQQQKISSVAHLFWQDLNTEMVLLRLAKQGYRGMKVPLRNVLNWEAACVSSTPGQVLSTYLLSVISVAQRVADKESAISIWGSPHFRWVKVCVFLTETLGHSRRKGISFGVKEEKSRWKAALGTRTGRKTYGFHFPFKSCQNLGSPWIQCNSPGMILWCYSMICSLHSSAVF